MKNNKTRPVMLLIEDNEGDAILAREAILFNKSNIDIVHVYDGDEAFAKLFDDDLKPDLILLDLNLPGMSGFEILKNVKSEPKTSKIPAVIFSTSCNNSDRDKCLDMNASMFITKPLDLYEYFEVFRKIENFLENESKRRSNERQ